jgi:hypothetical protein
LSLLCTLTAAAQLGAGDAAMLHFTFRNAGPQPVHVLLWGTPFEAAWFAPYVKVWRDGKSVRFDGAMVKRGDPGAAAYLRFAAGQTMQAVVGLAPAFDVREPGRYRVEPDLWLNDVLLEERVLPRPRSQHVGQRLACNTVEFERAP